MDVEAQIITVLSFGRTVRHLASMDLVRAWLKGSKDYNTGVTLYLQFGADPLLKQSFRNEKETPFKKNKLLQVMQDLAANHTPVVHAEPAETSTTGFLPAYQQVRRWPGEQLKDELELELWNAYREKIKTQDLFRHALLRMTSDAERREACEKIIRLDDEMDDIILQRDHYQQHGRLPDEPLKDYEVDPLRIATRITSLTRYIRREKGNIVKKPGDTGAISRRQAFIEELNFYYKKLGKPLYADRPEETGPGEGK